MNLVNIQKGIFNFINACPVMEGIKLYYEQAKEDLNSNTTYAVYSFVSITETKDSENLFPSIVIQINIHERSETSEYTNDRIGMLATYFRYFKPNIDDSETVSSDWDFIKAFPPDTFGVRTAVLQARILIRELL